MDADLQTPDLHTEFDADNIAWLHINKNDSSTNTLNASLLDAFYKEILEIARRNPRGLVILSDKENGFIAGADVQEFTHLQNRDHALAAIQRGQEVLDRLAALPFPTVALIHGFCLGGGLEMALACRYRIARDDPATRLGLPEVLLGIHPGFGGTVRLTALAGAMAAMDLMLTGRSLDARAAKRKRIVDHVVPERHLRTAARSMILDPPLKKRRYGFRSLSNHTWVRPTLAKLLYYQTDKKVRREHYPAPYALIELWEKHADDPRAMMHAEAESVADLIIGATAQNLIRAFLLQKQLKALGRRATTSPLHVHVIGAGIMGGDIAAWCALSGLYVTLQDQSPERLAPAVQRAAKLFERRLKRPRLIQQAMDRLTPDHRGIGVTRADVIMEAIFEDINAKRSLFAQLDPLVRKDAILATNTSSIPLGELSSVLQEPGRLVGIHFFNPVAKMKLVEIVHDASTTTDAIDKAVAFTRAIDRLPLPVSSTPGFLVNRILMPYLLEAVRLESEGVPPTDIDRQAVGFGMPMGPIELADAVGLDVCLHVAKILSGHFNVDVPKRLSDLVEQGRLGRKTGVGFYRYKNGKPEKGRLPKTYHTNTENTDRMILILLNEVVSCLREKVVDTADHLDAGMIYGAGFAPFLGGPLQYIETVGADVLLQRLHNLEQQFGPRFKPDPGWEFVSGFGKNATPGKGA
ncbi:MAG: 3-hydroxyacyl-CoA dehydrogenase NAD-binding domain-containing protein [Thiogranum sp.]|nr:3-hydroxyacyl-CoA dehydrogenase NAD-binding domain-containing protein [Thiogranum sp.]